MTSIIDLQSGQWIDLGGKHEAPDPDLASDTLRRISSSYVGYAASARAERNETLALLYDLKASEYLERARRIEWEEARKARTNEFLDVIGARIP